MCASRGQFSLFVNGVKVSLDIETVEALVKQALFPSEPTIKSTGQQSRRVRILPQEEWGRYPPRFNVGDSAKVTATGKIITIRVRDLAVLPHGYGSTETDPRYGEPVHYYDDELEPVIMVEQ